jgi:hypothetical protein
MKIKEPTHDFFQQAPTSTEDYIRQQKLCGLAVGDKVIITRRAESYEGGWIDVWISPMKTYFQDRVIHTITQILDVAIICSGISYPFFVLMPLSQAEVDTLEKVKRLVEITASTRTKKELGGNNENKNTNT